jgi:restriction system protein
MKYLVDNIIDAKSLSFEEWYRNIIDGKGNEIFPSNCFPNNEICDEYLKRINEFSEIEIKSVLRQFLVNTCNYGSDSFYAKVLLDTKSKIEIIELINKYEHIRRLLSKNPTWEGITWILDLLPDSPNDAIKVLDSYFSAHCLLLPDFAVNGLNDASTIISAKYITYEYPQQKFLELTPTEFEWIVEELYKSKGYKTHLTQKTHDGGIDIIAERIEKSEREKILIQCKRYSKNISVKEVRELNGVINDYPLTKGEKITKGIIISSSDFTYAAKKLYEKNYSIELINFKELSKELNKYLGRYWFHKRSNIFREKRKAYA